MLFLGYCGWGRNQLQGELNVGVWKMASVDSRVLVRELREETQQLRQLPQLGLDDGIGSWRHLWLAKGVLEEQGRLSIDLDGAIYIYMLIYDAF